MGNQGGATELFMFSNKLKKLYVVEDLEKLDKEIAEKENEIESLPSDANSDANNESNSEKLQNSEDAMSGANTSPEKAETKRFEPEAKSELDSKTDFESEPETDPEILALQEEYNASNFRIQFSIEEKIKCLEEITSRLMRILYVYDKSFEKDSKYNYKVFCGAILLYVSTSNELCDFELVSVIVNLNSILLNNLNRQQVKKLVFDSKNKIDFLIEKFQRLQVIQEAQKEKEERAKASNSGVLVSGDAKGVDCNG